MTPAELARKNAIPLEIKKDGLQQRQNGDWVLRFVVQASDMDERITRAGMGTRYQAVLVAIGDDELPITQAEKETNSKPAPTPQPKDKPAGAKRDWRDLSPQQQAGIRCDEERFWAFLNEERQYCIIYATEAAEAVREICGVKSRSELATNHKAKILWHQLDNEYQAWLLKERVGA